jgi:hypothetical protein
MSKASQPERKFATREEATRPNVRRYHECYVPEEDRWYRFQSLTELERSEWEEAIATEDGRADSELMKAELLVRVCVDGEGQLLFAPEDATVLSRKKDAAVIARLYAEATDHVTFERGSAEDLRKNSPRVPAGSSP